MSKKTRDDPVFLTAQDFLDGDVIFFDGNGWSRNFADAAIARTEAEKAKFQERGRVALQEGLIVDAVLIAVEEVESGVQVPRDFRERIRVLGPTIRRDLGKQAEGLAGKVDNVSL